MGIVKPYAGKLYKKDNGDYATLITYSDAKFTDNLPEIEETVEFEQDISDKKKVLEWLIDRRVFLVQQDIKNDEFYNEAYFCIEYLINLIKQEN